MKKVCIFDLDGTLTDTLDSIAYFVNTALKKHHLDAVIPTETFKMLVGDGARILIERAFAYISCSDMELLESVLNTYTRLYDENFFYLCSVYDGVVDMLATLRKHNITLAVFSNKPHASAVKVIEHFFEKGVFADVRGQKEGVPIKPDPTVALDIAKKFSAKPQEVVYIGDTGTDMRTGKSAGFFTVGVLWGFREKAELVETGANAIIAYPQELVSLVLDSVA